MALTFNGKSVPCELDKANLSFDTDAVLDQMTAGQEAFPLRGAVWLKALIGASAIRPTPLCFLKTSCTSTAC